jgi:hypothetical protein
MMDDELDFSGFAPFVKDIHISAAASMLTAKGEILSGHIVKLDFGEGGNLILSASDEVLQKLFFLLLKVFSHGV